LISWDNVTARRASRYQRIAGESHPIASKKIPQESIWSDPDEFAYALYGLIVTPQSPGFPGNGKMGDRGDKTVRFPQTTREKIMSTLTFQMSESLARQLREYADKEGLTVDQLLASAAAEKLSALMTMDHLRQRAVRAKREDFTAFLDASPNVPPLPGDEL
jgi:hypothetical protein